MKEQREIENETAVNGNAGDGLDLAQLMDRIRADAEKRKRNQTVPIADFRLPMGDSQSPRHSHLRHEHRIAAGCEWQSQQRPGE